MLRHICTNLIFNMAFFKKNLSLSLSVCLSLSLTHTIEDDILKVALVIEVVFHTLENNG